MRFHFAACISLLSLVGTTTADRKAVPFEKLDRNNAVLVVDDYQTGISQLARDFDTTVFRAHMIAHAAIGKLFTELPVILTTQREQLNGPLIPEILNMYPNVPIIRRVGELDAWDSAEFRQAIRATGRSQIIIAGIATDVCTTFLALSLRAEGYSVWANGEASGTTTPFVRDLSNDRMREAGVQVVSLLSIVMDLWGNTNNPPGSAAVGAWSRQYNPAARSAPGAVAAGA